MRRVLWKDKKGRNHAAFVRDGDGDDVAQQGFGISADPPDVNRLSCAKLLRNLHNELLARGLVTQDDVIKAQNGVTGAVLAVFKREVLQLYR